jgi:hypothetical protein
VFIARLEEEREKMVQNLNAIRDKITDEANKRLVDETLFYLTGLEKLLNDYIAQENTIAGIKKASNAMSFKVKEGLAEISKGISVGAHREPVVEVAELDLAVSLYECMLLVSDVLAAQDNFVHVTNEGERQKYEQLIFENMSRLTEVLNKTKLLLPEGDLAHRFETIMKDRVDWESITKNFVKSIKELRDMQDPLLAEIRSVLTNSQEMVNRCLKD